MRKYIFPVCAAVAVWLLICAIICAFCVPPVRAESPEPPVAAACIFGPKCDCGCQEGKPCSCAIGLPSHKECVKNYDAASKVLSIIDAETSLTFKIWGGAWSGENWCEAPYLARWRPVYWGGGWQAMQQTQRYEAAQSITAFWFLATVATNPQTDPILRDKAFRRLEGLSR